MYRKPERGITKAEASEALEASSRYRNGATSPGGAQLYTVHLFLRSSNFCCLFAVLFCFSIF